MASLKQGKVERNILTVDIEDWYQGISRYAEVQSPSPRLGQSLRKVLDLLEKHGSTATFFVLGEVASRYPELVEEMTARGHEVGCHGFHHVHVGDLGREAFDRELGDATELLEKICREKILSFRAAFFSLTKETSWILGTIRKHGYIYDSSIFPTHHPFYGVPNAPDRPYRPSFSNIEAEDENGGIVEFPILARKYLGINVPLGGGAYLRFLGNGLVASAIKKRNEEGWPATIYFHPWELDDFVPDVKLSPFIKFVTFHRIGKVQSDLESLLKTFKFVSIREMMEGST